MLVKYLNVKVLLEFLSVIYGCKVLNESSNFLTNKKPLLAVKTLKTTIRC